MVKASKGTKGSKNRESARTKRARADDEAPTSEAQQPDRTATSAPQSNGVFPIVGVGASAGGLEAFTRLVQHLPDDTGMGFVLVQHLDPEHESKLPQLLGRATTLPVLEVVNNTPVEPNHIYVIPPNRSMTIEHRILRLRPRNKTNGQHRQIDHFFESLAADQGHHAIGVILSGTATDGTMGLQAIKGADGITFAQDESAKYDSMPRSAIAAGDVDFVLPPEKIAIEIARIAEHPFVAGSVEIGKKPAEGEAIDVRDVEQDALRKILLQLRNKRGVDFTLYKPNTIRRRIMRRMVLAKIKSLNGYATHLRNDAAELGALYQDMLIAVTGFFRNPEAFEVLKRKVFPKILKQRSPDDAVRVWTVGCATGQEAYSIAMAFLEYSTSISQNVRLQVFATDLNQDLLDKARAGLYSKTLVHDVSPARLRRFFVEEDGGYRICKMIREMCVFARQNAISDPPFSRIDLISCRNLLIYLEPELQKRLLPMFHYALKPNGFLFLGVSESIGTFSSLFGAVDKKFKVFARKAGKAHDILPLLADPSLREVPKIIPDKSGPPELHTALPIEVSAQREADRVSLARYGPPGVVINSAMEILQFRGDTHHYLVPPQGRASFNLLKMAREGLLYPLRSAINKARRENKRVRTEDLAVSQDGSTKSINLEVIPLKNLREQCLLVLFEPADSGSASAIRKRRPSASQRRQESREIQRLEQELAATRDYLQAVQEQYDAASEELQASSEETQSANEELQSINEELETSKEELESTNEELTTVNEWMANRNAELSRLNSDIINLQSSISVPIVLLGRDLAIRRFTQPAEKLFNLLASDVGRPLGVIRHNLNFEGLEHLVSEVIDTVAGQEREVRDREGRWFLLRVRPYMTVENKIDGAVILLVDITNQKNSEEAKGRLAAIVEYSEDAIIGKDLKGIITTWNHGAAKLFGYTAQEAIGRPVSMLAPPGREHEMMEILERIRRRENVEQYDTVRVRKDGTSLNVSLSVSPIFDANGEIVGASKIARDITARKVAEDERTALLIREQAARADAETANRLKDEFLALVSHEVRTPLNAIVGWIHLLRAGKLSEDQIEKALESIDRNASAQGEIIDELLDTSRIITGKLQMESKALEITSIIEAALQVMRPAAEAKSITVDTDLDCHAGLVWGDSARLQQVLWNLLSNAIKFTPRGGRVDVGCRQSETSVVITIKDSGEGMDPEFLPFAFDRFRQADASTARIHSGLGLGLSIVRNIVEMHGGTVSAESHGKERGSTFTVTLPAMIVPNPTPTPGSAKPWIQQSRTESDVTAPPARLASLDGMLILVVEDDEDTRELLKVALTFSGAEAIVCGSSVEALAQIERRRPDCIISDVGMPGEDGYQFMKKLRLSSRRNGGHIPAIALSGFAGNRHRRLAETAGYEVHLAKPVELDQLTAEIARLVGQKR